MDHHIEKVGAGDNADNFFFFNHRNKPLPIFNNQLLDISERGRYLNLLAGSAGAVTLDSQSVIVQAEAAQEQITRDVLIFESETSAAAAETRQAELAVNHTIGFQAMLPVIAPQFPIETAEHADQLVAMYGQIGRALDEMTQRIREGIASGRTPPRYAVGETIKQLDAFAAVPVVDDPLPLLSEPVVAT